MSGFAGGRWEELIASLGSRPCCCPWYRARKGDVNGKEHSMVNRVSRMGHCWENGHGKDWGLGLGLGGVMGRDGEMQGESWGYCREKGGIDSRRE